MKTSATTATKAKEHLRVDGMDVSQHELREELEELCKTRKHLLENVNIVMSSVQQADKNCKETFKEYHEIVL